MVLDQVSPKGEGADNWHSDNTFMEEPPLGSILKAVRLPSVGGDTCFANAAAAYESLSDSMRRLVDELSAVHDITKPMTRAVAAGIFDAAKLAELQEQWPPVEHPVARTHPVTGRKALFVNSAHTVGFKGMTAEESAPLLRFLLDWLAREEFTCRFRWQVDSLAIWDNRCSQHYPLNDYHGFRRVMHRVTIKGERPV